MNSLKVLIVSNRWNPDGGVENFIRLLIQNSGSEIEYTVAALLDEVVIPVSCRTIGPVLESRRIRDMYVNAPAIVSMMQSQPFDVVHIQASNGSAFFLAHLAEKAGIRKRIIHSHNNGSVSQTSLAKNVVGRASVRFWRNAPTDLWACSSDAGSYLFGDKPFKVFLNGIDIDRFAFSKEKRARVRAELGVDEGTFLLGSIGRIAYQKNPLFQLRVFAELKKIMPDSKFCMVGAGDMEDRRDAEIERLGLVSSVIPRSRTSAPDAFYSAFDALIFPSIFEGFSFVTVEAQAEGLPIYASDAVPPETGITELISYSSLEDGEAVWAQKIASAANRCFKETRLLYSERIKQAGFDQRDRFSLIGQAYLARNHVVAEERSK